MAAGNQLTLKNESEEAAPSSGKELKKPSAEHLETHVSCHSTVPITFLLELNV